MKTPLSKEPSGWTLSQIDDALAQVGLNRAAIARDLKLSQTTVADAAKGVKCSQRVHNAISGAVNVDKKRIWPKFYLHGTPRRGPKMAVWNHQEAA
jgi:lambda repressor-like predicted transcriptional regulator